MYSLHKFRKLFIAFRSFMILERRADTGIRYWNLYTHFPFTDLLSLTVLTQISRYHDTP